jgi:hypothetical protein
MAKANKAATWDEPTDAVVDAVERVVRETGALTFKKVGKTGLPSRVRWSRRGELALQEALIRRGLERTAKHVRVPLLEQMRAVFATPRSVPKAKLTSVVAGLGPAAERDRAIEEARKAGVVKVVLVDGKEHVASVSVDTVPETEMRALRAQAEALVKWLRKSAPKRSKGALGVLPAEVAARVHSALGAAPTRGGVVSAGADGAPLESSVVDVVRETARASSIGIAFVPDVVTKLMAKWPVDQVLRALLDQHGAGRIELQPDSHLDAPAPEQARLMPTTRDGTRLAYVRPLGGER